MHSFQTLLRDLATLTNNYVRAGIEDSPRFRTARAAVFTTMQCVGSGRLITTAVTRPQRAGRAFAAELLAPASALAKRVSGRVGDREVVGLSEEFRVSPRLIEHQIENHGLDAAEA